MISKFFGMRLYLSPSLSFLLPPGEGGSDDNRRRMRGFIKGTTNEHGVITNNIIHNTTHDLSNNATHDFSRGKKNPALS